MTVDSVGLSDELMPLVGEFAWHSLTVDPRIPAESEAHLAEVERVLEAHPAPGDPVRLLEVGAYAHTTGYALSERHGIDVTLLDVSASTLRLGRDLAAPTAARPLLVAGDFHRLPFEDESFDAVVVRSSLHHTWRWRRVVGELLRVLNRQGILFLENEPCGRSCCFHLFRTNRLERFTPFEQQLDDLGVLRTFAEPFYGSRPETLFGMVENQTIPIGELLSSISRHADFVETTVVPEQAMGELEHAWLQEAHLAEDALAERIAADLAHGRDQARPSFGRREEGLGFSLPDDRDIARLAERTAAEIRALPTPSAELGFRVPLSAVFGASVRLVARKRGAREHASAGRLGASFPERQGVVYGFYEEMAALLAEARSQLPDVQRADAQGLAHAYPMESWRLSSDGGVAKLLLTTQPGPIRLPPADRDRLLLVRYGCLHNGDGPSTVSLAIGGERIHRQQSWLSESYFCSTRVPASEEPTTVTVECRADGDYADAALVIYLANLLPLSVPRHSSPPISEVMRS